MSDLFDFLALGMSAIGIGVSVWAKRDSKRSADAAELSAGTSVRSANAAEKSAVAADRSANEAEKTSNLTKTGLLAEHFLNVDYLFDDATGDSVRKSLDIGKDEIEAGKTSLRHLKNIIQDEAFCKILDDVVSVSEQRNIHVFGAMVDGSGKQDLLELEAEAESLRATYAVAKRKYLHIG